MTLSKDIAKGIVMEIGELMHNNINMMDETGLIIASTDQEREGTFHSAAIHVLHNNLDVLFVEDDTEYPGSKKGINLPIKVNQTCVGVIGITGERQEVEQFGKIIQKMAEVILQDYSKTHEKIIYEGIRTRYLEEWILSPNRTGFTPEFLERGARLGMHIQRKWQLFILLLPADTYSPISGCPQHMRSFERWLAQTLETDNIRTHFKTGNKYVVALPAKNPDDCLSYVKTLLSAAKKQHGIQPVAGVESTPTDYKGIYSSYLHAEKSLAAALAKSLPYCLYNDLYLELFINHVPSSVKAEYIQKVFSKCQDKEIAEWKELLEVFYKNNGSINDTADALFMHKNTLQYKLRRIAEKTGNDPRKISCASLYQIAFEFFESEIKNRS